MILSNVIFPAPSGAYLANLFFPLSTFLALASECAIFIYLQRGVISTSRSVAAVVGANLLSWTVGLAPSMLLPSGLVPQLVGDANHQSYLLTTGPDGSTIAWLSFFWA